MDPTLRSPKERPLFTLGVIFSSVFWLALVVSVVGIAYGLVFMAFAFAARALMLARIRGDGVRLSRRQMPELYARCEAAAARLGLAVTPETYVIQADGALNAFATRFLSRDFMVLHADLLERCHDPKQADFVIGHELGHLAAGHLTWRLFLAPFMFVPWIGPAYSRACEYTSDRCGHAVADDLNASMRGLVVLSVGHVADRVDLEAFVAQRRETEDFWEGVYELVSTHPFLTKRAAALEATRSPTAGAAPQRHALAYILGPFFGVAAGTPASAAMIVVLYFGMLGAVAAPMIARFARMQAQGSGGPATVPGLTVPGLPAPAPPAPARRGPYTTEPAPPHDVEPGVTLQEVTLRRRVGPTSRVWIYRPQAAHPPVVLVPPAGGNGFSGLRLDGEDNPEWLLWARAGFVVVTTDLDGPPPADPNDDAGWGEAVRAFRASEGGMANMREALDVALTLAPEADATRVMVAGHSSAGAQSLVFAARDRRVRLCAAFMPVADWRTSVTPQLIAILSPAVPDFADFVRDESPVSHVAALRVPVLLTASADDSRAPAATVSGLADALRARGADVDFRMFEQGGHYEPMVREGVPAAIAWARARFGLGR